jgi:conjugal transfer/type IV secretion protein DotA/TraY
MDSSEDIKENIKKNNILKNDLMGYDEYKNSKISYFLGISGIRKGVKGVVSPLKYFFVIFSMFFNMVLGRKTNNPNYSHIHDPKERFNTIISDEEISNSDIEKLFKNNKLSSFFYFILSIVFGSWGLYLYQTPSYQPSFILDYIFPFFPLFFTIPLYLKHKYWAVQMEQKSLFSFKDFLKNPVNLLPFYNSNTALNHTKFLFILTVSALLLIPQASYAQFSFTDTLPETDLFYQLLQMIAPIGPVEPTTPISPWVETLGNSFQAFNVTLLTVGSMMLGWHTIAGTVASAYEGQVMGQRWHTIWAPVRVTAGIGSLAPISKGFCAAQILVIQLIVWGGGIANEVWTAYIDTFDTANAYNLSYSEDTEREIIANPGATLSEVYRSNSSKEFVVNLFEREVCLSGMATAIREAYNQRFDEPFGPDTLTTERFWIIVEQDLSRGFWSNLFSEDVTEVSERVWRGYDDPYTYLFDGPDAVVVNTRNIATDIPLDGVNRYAARSGEANPKKIVIEYGHCGTIEIDLTSAKAVADYIKNNVVDQENARGMTDASPDLSENWAVLDDVNNVIEAFAGELNSNVLPPLGQAARILGDAAVGIESGTDNPISMLNTSVIDGLIAESFINYKDAMYRSLTDVLGSVDSWSTAAKYDELTEIVKGQGWAASGSFYIILARLQEMVWSVGNFVPSQEEIDLEAIVQGFQGDYQDILGGGPQDRYYGVYYLYKEYMNQFSQTRADQVLEDLIQTETSDEGIVEQWFTASVISLQNYMFNLFNPDPYTAMTEMINLGDDLVRWITVIAAVVFIGSKAISILGGIFSNSPLGRMSNNPITDDVADLLGPAIFFVKMAIIIIFIVAVIHAYVLPLMPYILMTFFVMGMLVLVAEALVAAPIWAFFHVRLDGNDFIDQVQRPGYMIAFNLLLRPSLAVFGLILSFSIFGAVIWFVNETFSIAGKSLMLGQNGGVIATVVTMVILTYIHYQVAIRSFTLITQVPDRVTRWFGQGGENLGEQQDAERSNTALVGQISSRGERMGAGLKAAGKGASTMAAGGASGVAASALAAKGAKGSNQ